MIFVLATLLAEAHHAIQGLGLSPFAHSVRRRPGDQTQRQILSRRDAHGLFGADGCASQSIMERGWRHSTTLEAGRAPARCAPAVTRMGAQRGVADRLLAVACAMLQTRTACDPSRQGVVSATQKPA
jgi:hypothetical protein